MWGEGFVGFLSCFCHRDETPVPSLPLQDEIPLPQEFLSHICNRDLVPLPQRFLSSLGHRD